jgi:hypothetical protein
MPSPLALAEVKLRLQNQCHPDGSPLTRGEDAALETALWLAEQITISMDPDCFNAIMGFDAICDWLEAPDGH